MVGRDKDFLGHFHFYNEPLNAWPKSVFLTGSLLILACFIRGEETVIPKDKEQPET
jgi:hypothetical protein